jgi:hypothetical protein
MKNRLNLKVKMKNGERRKYEERRKCEGENLVERENDYGIEKSGRSGK